MFGKIAGFEFRYQVTNPVFWVASIIFALLTFGLAASDNVSMGLPSTVFENGPFGLSLAACAFSLFFMFVTTAFVANVVVRDSETGFGPIVKATRINKFDYLIGRFTGATAAACLAFAAIPLGIFIGSFMPWLDPESIGPNQVQYYAYAYLVFGLPNVILTSAVFFAVATMTRSMMASYVAAVAFLIGYFVVTGVLGQKPEFEETLAYLEPLGSGAFGLATKYYTTLERNTVLPALDGVILWNRLLALGLSALFLVLAFLTFRFSEKPAKANKKQKLAALADSQPTVAAGAGPLPHPAYNASTAVAQLLRRVKFELGQVFLSPAYIVLVVIGIALSVAQLYFTGEIYGTQTILLTRIVIDAISGNMGLIATIIAAYYAGELVWREKDRKVHEIVDASSAPDWVFIIPKTVTIALVLVSTLVFGVIAAVIVQASHGVTDFEFDKYLVWYIAPMTVTLMLFAVLSVFVQTLVPHKFWGWGIMLLWLISGIVLDNLGFEHNLYNYGGWPGTPTSDMNGLGQFWIARSWFQLYWSAFAVILLVLSYALLRRGAETRLAPRFARLPRRLKGGAGVVALVALLVFIGAGAFIYVNTNVWNTYRTRIEEEQWLAAYEHELLKYETTPQPQIIGVKLNVDLYPHQPGVKTRGSYVLRNDTSGPVTQVHLRADRDLKMTLSVPGARLTRAYDRFNYFVYTFDTPMQPGETRTVGFVTDLSQRGFRNRGNMTRVADNGTFISNNEIAPLIGMDRTSLLQDPAKRHKYKLPRQLRIPELGTPGADRFNYLRNDSGFVNSDITITTVADQTPIAPGYKRSDVTRNGRRTAHFVSESPILNFFSIQSARYAVKTETHKGVEISVFYYPGHPWNVDRMIRAAELSLDYFQANFSPYQFRQIRYIEFPAFAGSFAQSFANTVPWSENLGFTADIRDPDKIDYVTYVGAHEIAHQWWAHQIIGANEQGMTMLSETLAQYSALMVMEHLYGPDHIRKFLKYELDRYLRARGGDLIGEQPLARNENQDYVHYRKGSLAMYLLKDQMGEERVNAALRRVLAQYAFHNAPYPTSRDLVAAFRAEAGDDQGLQNLITDLFEKITLYDLKAKSATVRRRPDGRFDVTITLDARKLYADAKGKETDAPLDETFDIGLFTAEPGKPGFGKEDVVMFRAMPLKSGPETLRFTVDRAPTWVGVDPYNKRIDRNSDDNLVKVDS
ncbi:MAG: aminopeptidase [Caulobacteraceae bacterium]|nr:aminopeptidase [Caulobacteraceae bacterium]